MAIAHEFPWRATRHLPTRSQVAAVATIASLEDVKVAARGEQGRGQLSARVDDVLAIVENEQHVAVRQKAAKPPPACRPRRARLKWCVWGTIQEDRDAAASYAQGDCNRESPDSGRI